jgi:hypothetical protein
MTCDIWHSPSVTTESFFLHYCSKTKLGPPSSDLWHVQYDTVRTPRGTPTVLSTAWRPAPSSLRILETFQSQAMNVMWWPLSPFSSFGLLWCLPIPFPSPHKLKISNTLLIPPNNAPRMSPFTAINGRYNSSLKVNGAGEKRGLDLPLSVQ